MTTDEPARAGDQRRLCHSGVHECKRRSSKSTKSMDTLRSELDHGYLAADNGCRVLGPPGCCCLYHCPDAQGHGLREHDWTLGDPKVDCTCSHRFAGRGFSGLRREMVRKCSAFCNLASEKSRLSCKGSTLLQSFGGH
jgi:hypothetical protein